MPDTEEDEVIGQEIWPGHKRQRRRGHHDQGVHDAPEAVFGKIATKLVKGPPERAVGRHGRGMVQRGAGVMAQCPEQPVLGHSRGQLPLHEPPGAAARLALGITRFLPPFFFFAFRHRLFEPGHHPREEPASGRPFHFGLNGLGWRLTVQDKLRRTGGRRRAEWDQIDVHVRSARVLATDPRRCSFTSCGQRGFARVDPRAVHR